MNNFTFAYKKELFKLSRKKKFYVFTIIGILISIIRYSGTMLIAKISDGEMVIRSNIAMEMLPVVIELILPLIILTAASDLFTHEEAEGTLKAVLLQPISRFKLLTAKAAAILTVGTASLLVMLIANLILTAISGGSTENVFLVLAAYIIDIIPLIGIVMLGILINVLLKNAAAATLLSLAVYAFFKYIGIYYSWAGAILFTANAKLHQIILGAGIPLHILLYKFGIILGSILILYSASYIIFDKKNV